MVKILCYINNEDQVYPEKEKFYSHYDFIYFFSFGLTGDENLVFACNSDSSWVFGIKDHDKHFASCDKGVMTFNSFYTEKDSFNKERRMALFKFLFYLINLNNFFGLGFENKIIYKQKFLQISNLYNFQFIVQVLNFEKSNSYLYRVAYLKNIKEEINVIDYVSIIENKENVFGDQTVALLGLNEYLTKKCYN